MRNRPSPHYTVPSLQLLALWCVSVIKQITKPLSICFRNIQIANWSGLYFKGRPQDPMAQDIGIEPIHKGSKPSALPLR